MAVAFVDPCQLVVSIQLAIEFHFAAGLVSQLFIIAIVIGPCLVFTHHMMSWHVSQLPYSTVAVDLELGQDGY